MEVVQLTGENFNVPKVSRELILDGDFLHGKLVPYGERKAKIFRKFSVDFSRNLPGRSKILFPEDDPFFTVECFFGSFFSL